MCSRLRSDTAVFYFSSHLTPYLRSCYVTGYETVGCWYSSCVGVSYLDFVWIYLIALV